MNIIDLNPESEWGFIKSNEIKQFPKMYHPTDDLISIPLFVNGKKIVV